MMNQKKLAMMALMNKLAANNKRKSKSDYKLQNPIR